MEIYRKTWAEIDVSHLEHNLELIRKNFSSNTFLCPMVKANAYGHGDVKLAKFYENWNVKNLGVCLIEEGLLIRRLGVKIPILVFRGFDHKGAQIMRDLDLTPVVSTVEQLEILASFKSLQTLHLKFDTGMNRLGFSSSQTPEILKFLKSHEQLKVMGVLTHLYQSEDGLLENSKCLEQIKNFLPIVKEFENLTDNFHVLNSGGIVCKMSLGSKSSTKNVLFEKNWGLRPGLLMYGYNPVEGTHWDFKPALTLKSHTSVVRQVKKGEGVSYNHTWVAPQDSQVAVVPIGYADGWHRLLSNRAEVLWNGQRARVVGNICMDYLMVDVTDLKANAENEVVFLGSSQEGSQISAQEVAKLGQTIPWEILTSIGERVPRVYI